MENLENITEVWKEYKTPKCHAKFSNLGKPSWLKGGNLPEYVKQQISNTLKGNKNAEGHSLTEKSIQQMKETFKERKYHWYNNGIISCMYSEYDKIPEGYVLGRKIK